MFFVKKIVTYIYIYIYIESTRGDFFFNTVGLELRRLRIRGDPSCPRSELIVFFFVPSRRIAAFRLPHAQLENAESTTARVQTTYCIVNCYHTRCISESLPFECFSNDFVCRLCAPDQVLTSINAWPMYWRGSLRGILLRWRTRRARYRVAFMRQRARFTTCIRSVKGCDAVSRMTTPPRRAA